MIIAMGEAKAKAEEAAGGLTEGAEGESPGLADRSRRPPRDAEGRRGRACAAPAGAGGGDLPRRRIVRSAKSRISDLGRSRTSRPCCSGKHGYRRRKAQKKKTMGPRNPNRNAQFENIARLKKEYLKAGLPVVSMDTKK